MLLCCKRASTFYKIFCYWSKNKKKTYRLLCCFCLKVGGMVFIYSPYYSMEFVPCCYSCFCWSGIMEVKKCENYLGGVAGTAWAVVHGLYILWWFNMVPMTHILINFIFLTVSYHLYPRNCSHWKILNALIFPLLNMHNWIKLPDLAH